MIKLELFVPFHIRLSKVSSITVNGFRKYGSIKCSTLNHRMGWMDERIELLSNETVALHLRDMDQMIVMLEEVILYTALTI